MKRLKLKKNEFGLRIVCSSCNQTFNQKSIKNCTHFDKQKYKLIVYTSGSATKSKLLKTRDFDKALEEAVVFKNKVKRGNFTIITKNEKELVSEANLLLMAAADNYINSKNGNVEYSFQKRKSLSKNYLDSMLYHLKEFFTVLKNNGYTVHQMLVKDITEEHLEAWWNYVTSNYENPSTINARIRALRGFINHVNKRYNLRFKNHFLEIELLDEVKKIRTISKNEFDLVCDAVKNKSPYFYFTKRNGIRERKNRYRDYLIDAFKLGLYTGLRREELFNLKWSDIRSIGDEELLVVKNLKVQRIKKKEYRPKYIQFYSDLKSFMNSKGMESKLGKDEYILCPNRSNVSVKTLMDCTSRAFKFYYSQAFPNCEEVLPFGSLRKTYLTYLSKSVGSDAIYLSSHSSNATLEKHYLDPKILAKGKNMKMFQ